VTGNVTDVNAVKDRHQRALGAVQDRFHVTGLPHALLYKTMAHGGTRNVCKRETQQCLR